MSLLSDINGILARWDDVKTTLNPSREEATSMDLAALDEIVALVKKQTNEIAQCANIVSHAELGLPDEQPIVILGFNAAGAGICVGDVVNHTEKPLKDGIVMCKGDDYKGETTAVVDWGEGKGSLCRLSRLVKA